MRMMLMVVALMACGGGDETECLVYVQVDAGSSSALDCAPCPGTVKDGKCLVGFDLYACRTPSGCDNVIE